MKVSYLITFNSPFEVKYFKDNIEEFFHFLVTPNKELINTAFIWHTALFLEIKSNNYLTNAFKPHNLLDKFPNTKVVIKHQINNSTRYRRILP